MNCKKKYEIYWVFSSFISELYQMTRNHIWTNIKEKSSGGKKINKTLNLIEYLILNSTEEMVNEFKEEIFYINMMKEFKSEDLPEIVNAG